MARDSTNTATDAGPPRAACLTPPAMGGVAVIQVVGRLAPGLVTQYLRARHPIDLQAMSPDEIRLCQWVDGEEVVDDALVAVRREPDGQLVIEISLHGGPRIVQRSLLMLQRAGARIVDPLDLLGAAFAAITQTEREILRLLIGAKTRAVALWLTEMIDRLPKEFRATLDLVETGRLDAARDALKNMMAAGERASRLLNGVRTVVVGRPNTGKSTLINSLAEREQAIVSDLPGTTRDWVEHPGAIDGIPFTFVDTAGIHDTSNPIEQEAIRRTHQQALAAEIILVVFDASVPHHSGSDLPWTPSNSPAEDRCPPPVVMVANKTDLPLHASWLSVFKAEPQILKVSATTRSGLGRLNQTLVEAADLTGWRQDLVAPVNKRQRELLQTALSALKQGSTGAEEAAEWLRQLIK